MSAATRFSDGSRIIFSRLSALQNLRYRRHSASCQHGARGRRVSMQNGNGRVLESSPPLLLYRQTSQTKAHYRISTAISDVSTCDTTELAQEPSKQASFRRHGYGAKRRVTTYCDLPDTAVPVSVKYPRFPFCFWSSRQGCRLFSILLQHDLW